MEPPALLSADHVFSSETISQQLLCESWRGTAIVSGPLLLGLPRLGIKADRRVGTAVTGNVDNLQCLMQLFQFLCHLFQTGSVATPPQCRTRSFFATSSLHHGPPRVAFLARTLQTFGLQNSQERVSMIIVSNGEFQSIVFVKSISEAVFVSNLLRHIRQERIDLDAVAAHMHGPAPPDKHKESSRFMQPLLGEIVSTIKTKAPPTASSSSQSPETEQLAKAKRKLEEEGIALSPVKDKQQKSAPSSTAPALPTTSAKTPVEQILEKELPNKLSSVPSSSSQDAVDKWLKKHQSQFRGKAAAFKKH